MKAIKPKEDYMMNRYQVVIRRITTYTEVRIVDAESEDEARMKVAGGAPPDDWDTETREEFHIGEVE
tara:strand:- start:375 stop:575 length:201 start_codon:yes stop_codon:yes gene_type:complete